jgi:hypothetical protein
MATLIYFEKEVSTITFVFTRCSSNSIGFVKEMGIIGIFLKLEIKAKECVVFLFLCFSSNKNRLK